MTDLPTTTAMINSIATQDVAALTKSFGCINCEWRQSSKCKFANNLPETCICQDRLDWLDNLIPIYDEGTQVGHERIQRDILLSLSRIRLLEYRELIQVFDERIKEKLRDGAEQKEINQLYKQRDKFEYWHEKYFKTTVDKHDAQVGRETVKKVEHRKIELSPKDIFNMQIKKNTVEAEVVNETKN